ncbi:MAG: response regulator, partial [Sedimenticolaceae bacterium]
MRLLLVEDDEQLADGIATDLRHAGFAVDRADNGIDAEYLGREQIYDAVILDLGLPGKPGLEVLRSWREGGLATPVLILTARDSWAERVLGLRSGADDYLGKPFHFEELSARVQALLRRSAGRAEPQLTVAGLRLDEERQRVQLADGTEVELTGTEFRLLRY